MFVCTGGSSARLESKGAPLSLVLIMVAQNLPVLLTGIFLGARRSCDGFFHPQPTSISSLISNPTRAAARAARGYGYGDGRQDDRVGNDGGANQHTSRLVSKARPGISFEGEFINSAWRWLFPNRTLHLFGTKVFHLSRHYVCISNGLKV